MNNYVEWKVTIKVFCDNGHKVFNEYLSNFEAGYLFYSHLTLDNIREACGFRINPFKAYVSLRAVDANGKIVRDKRNLDRVIVSPIYDEDDAF